MHPSTLTELSLAGPAGAIDVAINDPGADRRGLALIAHPHPLQGGTRDNKVVTTLARAFHSLGYCAARPNFRGVGRSQGIHDRGVGETDDLVAVAAELRNRYGDLPLVLAGFSFGASLVAKLAEREKPEWLVLVGVGITRIMAPPVPPGTLVIHGENDDTVPLAAVMDWARPQELPVVVVPGADHFFHRKLHILRALVQRNWNERVSS